MEIKREHKSRAFIDSKGDRSEAVGVYIGIRN